MPKRTQSARRSRARAPVYRADADDMVRAALERFADAVAAQMRSPVRGGPEDQLRPPFVALMEEVGLAREREVACTGETPLPDQIGRPDYAVSVGGVLQGYAELKAPGHGADGARFKGHDRTQFKRFEAIPNLLYTDGTEWALYRGGELTGSRARLSGGGVADGAKAVTEDAARAVGQILHDFLKWRPILPELADGRIDLKRFAAILAPLCRLLRDDVAAALRNPASPLSSLAATWREMLFPDASDRQFADAYAQTVVFALLLGRCEGADPLSPRTAADAVSGSHSLLSRALELLTDRLALPAIATSLGMLVRVIGAVPPSSLNPLDDPWLHFYEDFLAAYDPEMRKRTGVYYTPVEVVRAQVRLLDEILVTRLDKPEGFVDEDVVTLDPAVGTGTYLLAVIEHVINKTPDNAGAGAVARRAQHLAESIYGFELSVGPYAVADLRVSRTLTARGAVLPQQTPATATTDDGGTDDGGTDDTPAPPILLADTLESPHATPLELPLFLKPIAEQRAHAIRVKAKERVLVCLGNPPYGRHEAATADNKNRTGGWVRWGEGAQGEPPILNDFTVPVKAAGHGGHLKNIYNLYVYFWRWALWKVFEQKDGGSPGAVSLITASSWLDGPAFAGMREHMRRVCDAIWVLDLGGDNLGPLPTENVFAIQTPVAIVMACRSTTAGDPTHPARVRYTRIEGSSAEKLATLDGIQSLAGVEWRDGPDGWQDPFPPAADGPYFKWPLLSDLMPWQHTGVQLKRTWPIAPDRDTLERRWRGLLRSKDRGEAFRETPDRKVDGTYRATVAGRDDPTPISELPDDAPIPEVREYAYRSFDRQRIIADGRLMSRPRPDLWRSHGERQVYLSSLLTKALGRGPALTCATAIPDIDHFGSGGGKDVLPLYRTPDASEANVAQGVLDLLGEVYARPVTPEDLVAYIYGALAHPAFTDRFSDELESRQLRVPLTGDAALFGRVRDHGAHLLHIHTWARRFVPDGLTPGAIELGAARCTVDVGSAPPETFSYDPETRTLAVGDGAFAPVAPEVYGFEVSGLKVVRSWLRYRMRDGAGRKSSPLNDIRPSKWTAQLTDGILKLLWVLEATVEGYARQAELLEEIVSGECIQAAELPEVPEWMRKPPAAQPEISPSAPALDLPPSP